MSSRLKKTQDQMLNKKTANPVTEDRRIFLKQELHQFREDATRSEIGFPANLTNIERKYLHRVATELGLESRSSGSGTNRSITVKKKHSPLSENSKKSVIQWQLSETAVKVLGSIHAKELKDFLSKREATSKLSNNMLHSKSHDHKKIDFVKLEYSYRAAEHKRKTSSDFASLQQKRSILPAANYREAVCQLVRNHQIVLINGETGCGKSTQVPQFLLEDETIGPRSKIVITQPRRISAVSLAERISYERGETVGNLVGYNIRLESVQSSSTQLLFVTPGVLLRKLIDDPLLHEYTHIVIDEAHERDRFTEFLLILLRDLAAKRSTVRIVMMSATMHIMKLTSYFGDIPTLSIGSSVFPVQEYHLEHILKFTNYLQVMGGGTNTHNTTTSHVAHVGISYTCSFCQKSGFLSPEEYGTHAALCFPNPNNNAVAKQEIQLSAAQQKQIRLQELQYKLQNLQTKILPSATASNEMLPPPPPPIVSVEPTAPNDGEEAAAAAALEEEVEEDNDSTASSTYDSDEDHDDNDDMMQPSSSSSSPSYLIDQNEIGKDAQQTSYYSEEQNEMKQLLQQYQLLTKNNTSDDLPIDYDLIILLLNYIMQSEYATSTLSTTSSGTPGSILIFLPGWDDIMKLQRLLSSHYEYSNTKQYVILQLHSNIPKKEQQLVFQKCALPTQRKIILSTNIAETSVTIDDVTVVINTGRVKEKVYDPHLKLSYLKSTYVSKASANQRKGRAGRTQAGVCFHLYSKLRDQYLVAYPESELLRMPLEELVLQVCIISISISLLLLSL